MEPPMHKPKRHKPLNDLDRSHTPLDVNRTLISVVELSQRSWLVAGVIPGVERQPLKKLEPGETGLLNLLERWRKEAEKAGHKITRIAVAFEAGRDGFWLARWLRARGIEAHVIHASSVAVPREHRRAKTDRLDTELLKRAFLGWLRGERTHCKMAVIPPFSEEEAKRPSREHQSLVGEVGSIVNRVKATLARLGIRGFNPKLKTAGERLQTLRTPEDKPIPPNTLAELQRDLQRRRLLLEQIQQIEKARLERLKQAPRTGPNAMVLLLARVIGVGTETRICWCRRSCHAICETAAPSRATADSRAHPMQAATNAGRRASRSPATLGSGAGWSCWPGASCSSKRTAPWRSGFTPVPARRQSCGRK